MRKVVLGLSAIAITGAMLPLGTVTAAQANPAPAAVALPQQATVKFKNCTALNKVYKHGVGRSGARDRTSGKPVKNFKKSTSLYNKIMSYRDLDRDNDGIACEKR